MQTASSPCRSSIVQCFLCLLCYQFYLGCRSHWAEATSISVLWSFSHLINSWGTFSNGDDNKKTNHDTIIYQFFQKYKLLFCKLLIDCIFLAKKQFHTILKYSVPPTWVQLSAPWVFTLTLVGIFS